MASAGVCSMAGYTFRFCPALQQLHTLLQAGVVGEIYAAQAGIGVALLDRSWPPSRCR